MRVLVAGGGIAGLTVAHWLARGGADVVVAEKSSRLDARGYGLNLVGQCLSVLDEMGLRDMLEAQRLPVRQNRILERDGTLVRQLDISEFNSPRSGLFIRRSALQEALATAAGTSVDLRLSTPVGVIESTPDGVRAQLGASEESFSLAIGADGIHSAVRQAVCPDAETKSLNVQYVAVSFDARFGGTQGAYTINGPGGRAATLTMISDSEWTGLFWVRNSTEPVPVPEEAREYLTRHFGAFGWIVPEIIERIKARRAYCGEATQIRANRWTNGRATIIGDAAWCLSPVAARGAAAALVGARQLANSLTTEGDIDAACARFEREFRPVAERAQQVAARTIDYMLPLDEGGAAMQARYLRTMSEEAIQQAMRAQFADGF
jgi:2-polyprenyl-6-methoxyphenol hydroxylase-like FAD-dependent oxidoreductase